MPTPPAIQGRIVEDTVVPARGRWSAKVAKGHMLRIVDLDGKQGVDFLCYNANDVDDRYAAADTMKINGNLFIGLGTTLYSINCNPMMTVVADRVGFHDTIGGCCSDSINVKRYNNAGHGSCRANFLAEFKKWGLTGKDYAANVNFFAYVPIGPKGEMDFRDPLSEPGDYVDLRADMDVIAIVSNCPQINNPAAGFNPSPLRVVIWDPKG
jgi:urea carboxylase-associated protein 1